jgi:hypothetical protein
MERAQFSFFFFVYSQNKTLVSWNKARLRSDMTNYVANVNGFEYKMSWDSKKVEILATHTHGRIFSTSLESLPMSTGQELPAQKVLEAFKNEGREKDFVIKYPNIQDLNESIDIIIEVDHSLFGKMSGKITLKEIKDISPIILLQIQIDYLRKDLDEARAQLNLSINQRQHFNTIDTTLTTSSSTTSSSSSSTKMKLESSSYILFKPFIISLSTATLEYSSSAVSGSHCNSMQFLGSPSTEQAGALACKNRYLDFILKQSIPYSKEEFRGFLLDLLKQFSGKILLV